MNKEEVNRICYIMENATYLDNGCILSKLTPFETYPRIMVDRKFWQISRYLMSLTQELGDSFVLHKCDNSSCINVQHLYLGTQKDNIHDQLRAGTHKEVSKSHCIRGHLFDDKNTYVYKGHRYCRKCKAERERNSWRNW